ncbi:hypothetical protein ABI_12750 [Asticcacaulis biprosthecium C19]|uniref:Uncharacterized protein n=1 Tax=Asticcacaulis biprosthecium C19 TaxID=715226 RepID=F4QHV0_9CAUL|nr:hypothetical protein [Asticcacaulis biprosthecium]EGF92837.1 hypothetical protein ABI_12750 [Asticcacaulis biprosthecium C19]
MWKYLVAAVVVVAAPQVAMAQYAPKLIREAEYGTVREVEGEKLMIAVARDGCPAAWQPAGGGPCFDTLKAKLTANPVRVLGLYKAPEPRQRIAGRYGSDFSLFTARIEGGALVAQRLDLPTSDVTVPRNCYRLNGEGVGYVIAAENGMPNSTLVAYESQIVSCDGGPETPQGPYYPEGEPMLPGSAGVHHRTEELQVWGTTRYLAITGVSCDKIYQLRKTWCARPAVSYLQANPGVKEVDLIAARAPVNAGDWLSEKQIDQWVLKRKGKDGFKADSRWVNKSFLNGVAGCWATQAVSWNVSQQGDGLYITEGAHHACGAPKAPVPVNIYEAYGRDLEVVDCAERRGDWRKSESGCPDRIKEQLMRMGTGDATLVVLNQHGRVGDYLHEGGYVSYDVASARLSKEGALDIDVVYNYAPSVYMSNCSPMSGGPAESRGFVLMRSVGVTRAREYQWMACPVY